MRSQFSWDELGLGKVRSLAQRVEHRTVLPVAEARKLLLLGAEQRHALCFDTIAKHQEVWTIWDEDRLVRYGAKPIWVPIFPTKQVAVLSSVNDADAVAIPIPVDDYVDQFIPALANESTEISVFPSPETSEVILLKWDDFVVDLVGAWEQEYMVEAQSSKEFDDFAYQIFQRRMRSGQRGSNRSGR